MNKILDWESTRKHAKSLSIKELEYTIQDCVEACRANKGWNPDAEGYYQDEASVYQRELMSREPEPEPEPKKNKKAELILELMGMEAAENPSKITSPTDMLPYLEKYINLLQEEFVVATMNGAHEVMNVRSISKGIVNRTLAHPREIFRMAILDNATGIIIAHNHTSGNFEPSPEDDAITKRINDAGEIVGIQLMDHIVVSKRGYYSYLEEGKL